MPAENFAHPGVSVDPFYPDGYTSTEQDRARIISQQEKSAPAVGSINFKFPLSSFRRGFFEGHRTTAAAVRVDIKILLMTVPGERVMHKNMGSNVPILSMFEPTHKPEITEKIKLEMTVAIETYLPFLTIQNINILTSEDDSNLKTNQIRIAMAYIVHNQQSMFDQVTFTVTLS